jgi:hypothetical protein
MPINPVTLIGGALSFSVALAWNRAVSDTLNNITGKTTSTLLQAIVITVIIIIIVFLINGAINIYTTFTNDELKKSIIKSGNENGKVNLWLLK